MVFAPGWSYSDVVVCRVSQNRFHRWWGYCPKTTFGQWVLETGSNGQTAVVLARMSHVCCEMDPKCTAQFKHRSRVEKLPSWAKASKRTPFFCSQSQKKRFSRGSMGWSRFFNWRWAKPSIYITVQAADVAYKSKTMQIVLSLPWDPNTLLILLFCSTSMNLITWRPRISRKRLIPKAVRERPINVFARR